MLDDGILKDVSKKDVSKCLYETPSEDEKKEYDSLKSIEIDVE